jgi:hypothetical protein
MAISCQDLLASASCFNCVTPGMWSLIRLALLARIADGNTMSADVATLLAEGGCMACQAPGQQQLLELALLQLIQEGGGGGGSGCVSCVSTPPVAPPDVAQCECSVRIGIGDWVGFYWVWDQGFTDTWVQVPGGP